MWYLQISLLTPFNGAPVESSYQTMLSVFVVGPPVQPTIHVHTPWLCLFSRKGEQEEPIREQERERAREQHDSVPGVMIPVPLIGLTIVGPEHVTVPVLPPLLEAALSFQVGTNSLLSLVCAVVCVHVQWCMCV